MESGHAPSPENARAALRDLTAARRRIAERITSPWWYRFGAASSTAALFVGTGLVVGRDDPGGMAETASSLLVVLGAVVAPVALLSGLKRSTGVAIDRYSDGLGAWYVSVFALFGVAFVLQQFAGVPFALPVAGIGAFVATLVTERRIDGLLRERVRTGEGRR